MFLVHSFLIEVLTASSFDVPICGVFNYFHFNEKILTTRFSNKVIKGQLS